MKRLLLTAALLACAPAAHAEIALLANGQTFKLSGHRAEGDLVWLSLRSGGELTSVASGLALRAAAA